jgi:hypothetical protein
MDDMKAKGRYHSLNVEGLKDFPFKSYHELMQNVNHGQAKITRFSIHMEPGIESIITDGKSGSSIGMFIGLAGVIGSIVCCFLISWICLILVPVSFIIGGSITKSIYNDTILKAANDSEIIFSFLYQVGQVSVETSTGHFFYKRD